MTFCVVAFLVTRSCLVTGMAERVAADIEEKLKNAKVIRKYFRANP